MTQEELGEVLGITKGAVQKYESGQIRNLKADTIKKFCELFGSPPVFFIFDDVPDFFRVRSRQGVGPPFRNLVHRLRTVSGTSEYGRMP